MSDFLARLGATIAWAISLIFLMHRVTQTIGATLPVLTAIVVITGLCVVATGPALIVYALSR